MNQLPRRVAVETLDCIDGASALSGVLGGFFVMLAAGVRWPSLGYPATLLVWIAFFAASMAIGWLAGRTADALRPRHARGDPAKSPPK